MKGLENQTYLLAYLISNAVAVLMLWAAWKRPRLARLMFLLLFGWASWVNWTTALQNPRFYIEYADLSFLDLYEDFIRGWFSHHITGMVGFIATCQALIALSMPFRGWLLKTGLIGAVVFLVAIAPLGVGSAFPFSITASFALLFILKNKGNDYLWVRHKVKIPMQPLRNP